MPPQQQRTHPQPNPTPSKPNEPQFENNAADGNGGAIFFRHGAQKVGLTVTGTIFKGNRAGGGAGIYLHKTTVKVRDGSLCR
jgi:hypothetical protein